MPGIGIADVVEAQSAQRLGDCQDPPEHQSRLAPGG